MMPQNITVYIWLSTQHSIWSQDSYIIIYAMTNHEYHCTDTHHTCNRLSYIAHLLTLWCFTWHLIFILTLLANLARFKNLISVLYSEANFLPTHYEILHLILNVFLHWRVKLENMQLLPISVLSLYVKPQNSSCQTCCRLGSRDLYPGDQNVLKTVSVELNVCISQGIVEVSDRDGFFGNLSVKTVWNRSTFADITSKSRVPHFFLRHGVYTLIENDCLKDDSSNRLVFRFSDFHLIVIVIRNGIERL